ncbi:UDP-N-acetylmuramoyl-L-alanyl-D-glutamate--2,6-diaminopimelate ligase [Ruminococcaceae bacterium OttesenSCG-928-L11]|nr:UDP-N-acetylmuramoyl-L-alanyl-D-glutamate--2,6-diaminopimelate ligase [Ruminococcaceae bacterium OttesenSCG-928-L11]
MTLNHLLDGLSCRYGSAFAPGMEGADVEIKEITCDSRQAEQGSVFFCIKGVKSDGHDYAEKAAELGATAIVTERDLGLGNQIIVDDTHEAWGVASANFFGNPARRMKLLGVTGTNGKTSITYITKQILEQAGKTVGLIGTIHNEIGDMVIPAKHTTPDPYMLHAMLARMEQAGCEYVVMEVSSHALEQRRVAGCRFAVAAFTNLTQDHLDYHGDMEHYYAAKKKLFDVCDTAVVNVDDMYGRKLAGELACPVLTFSCERDEADYAAHNMKYTARYSSFVLLHNNELMRVKFPMPGAFSVSNALAAACMCTAVGIPMEDVVAGLNGCRGVPGRIEILDTGTTYTVIRDYAHSPDGLEKVLTAVREFAPGRIVVLFGCAGNRDRTKRPVMAEIAARLADFCILTSDNPRDEDPARIVEDAVPGFRAHKTPCKVIVDRYDAIKWALENCKDDDVLVLAGKGHEDYQVLGHGTIFFDEKVIVAELLEKMRK